MTKYKDTVEQVTTRILEDWALMMVEPTDVNSEIFASSDACFVSTIHFKGDFEGEYSIFCQKPFMQVLAENLLGEDDDGDEEDARDALREMTNVLCGNLLTECYGDDLVFDLEVIDIKETGVDQSSQLFNERTICFLADDEPVAVSFNITGEE